MNIATKIKHKHNTHQTKKEQTNPPTTNINEEGPGGEFSGAGGLFYKYEKKQKSNHI